MTMDFFSLPSEEKETVVKLFEKNWVKGDPRECWIWKGSISRKGYGIFIIKHKINGRSYLNTYSAHRFSWINHWKLPIPSKLFCCHTCDVPICINPHHLVLGNLSSNILDAMNRDRLMKVKLITRLSIADAIVSGLSLRAVGRIFNITQPTIYRYLRTKEVRDKYGIIDLSHRRCKKKVMHGQQSIGDTPVHSIPNPV